MQEKILKWFHFQVHSMGRYGVFNTQKFSIKYHSKPQYSRGLDDSLSFEEHQKKGKFFFEHFSLNGAVTITIWVSMQNPSEFIPRLGEKKYKIIAVEKTWTSSSKKELYIRHMTVNLCLCLYCGWPGKHKTGCLHKLDI